MNTFISLSVYGLADGAILALAALGFVLIYKATRVINFAQGEFLLVGAYTFYTAFVLMGLPWILASVVGVIVAVALGVVVERFVLRPLIGEHAISVIMVTIGLSAVSNPRSCPPRVWRWPGSLCPSTACWSSSSPVWSSRPSRSSSASQDTASRCARSPTTSSSPSLRLRTLAYPLPGRFFV